MSHVKGKVMITEKQKEFELVFQEAWDLYVELHKKFNSYRGQEINEANIVEINKLIQDIQSAFLAMYPTLNFIVYRAESAGNAIKDYQKFIDDLKSAGASENPPAPSPIEAAA